MLRRLRGPRALRVLGAGRGAAHLDLDGWVLTVLARDAPLLPNALAVPGPAAPPLRVGWDPAAPPAWDPVPPPLAGGPADVAALGAWLAARVPVPEVGPREAPARLLGRGPGLTPEGDDVLAGAAAGVRALAPAAGRGRLAEPLARALAPAGARGRTTALSATLLGLAAGGAAPEPVHRLLGARDADARERALSDLVRLGASTGRAWAAGVALAARWLADGGISGWEPGSA